MTRGFRTIRHMWKSHFRNEARRLRALGKTYKEISQALGADIPKATFSYWCRGLSLSIQAEERLYEKFLDGLAYSRERALLSRKRKREGRKAKLSIELQAVVEKMDDVAVAKIALAMLYLGEGAKNRRGTVCFGNSNPTTIRLFVRLIRQCYLVDETKFRCTVQCRADQPIEQLESFWSTTTDIPRTRFYAARIDPRTLGKPTLKAEYKGVCRLDYFSASVFNELMLLAELISMGR